MVAIGYSRTSTASQVDHLQTDALARADCVRVFHEVASGTKGDRPQLRAALDYCRAGDVLTVYKLDRVSRNTAHLLALAQELEDRQIGLASLTEQLDTTSPGGRMFFTVLAVLAQLERDVLVEQTLAGLTAARARGPGRWSTPDRHTSQARRSAGHAHRGPPRDAADRRGRRGEPPCSAPGA